VTIRPSNIAQCTRDDDSALIEEWLVKRGFIVTNRQEGHEGTLRLWQAIERIPGLAAVTQECRSLVGDEYELVEAFRRPKGKLAAGYPCPEPEGSGCVHAVVEHAPDDMVAVCRRTPRRCEAIPLRKRDIVVYELNGSVLRASIASTLQITQDEKASLERLPMTFRIGTYFAYAGFRVPCFMTCQSTQKNTIGRLRPWWRETTSSSFC